MNTKAKISQKISQKIVVVFSNLSTHSPYVIIIISTG